jgi:hypothetical protein
MGHRWTIRLLAFLGAVFAARGASAETLWSNYQGKGEINISVEDVNMNIQMEQIYLRKPSQMLLNLDIFGLKQTVFTDGNVEKTYNPAQGLLIEKKFLNLEKADTNPMVGAQASMEDLGRRIREAKTGKITGKETLIGFECDCMELETKELVRGLSSSGVLGNKKLLGQLGPTVKAWISRDWGIPLQVELSGANGKAAMTFKFTELKVNSDAVKDHLGLTVPDGTRRVSVTVDLADPQWESKMNAEIRKATEPKPQSSGGDAPKGSN